MQECFLSDQETPLMKLGESKKTRLTRSQRVLHCPRSSKSRFNSGLDFEIQLCNVPDQVPKKRVARTAALFGDVVSIKRHTSQVQKTIYQITYRTEDAALKAIAEFNELEMENVKLSASFAEMESRASLSIIIKRIPLTVNKESIIHLFRRFGDLGEKGAIEVNSKAKFQNKPRWSCSINYASFESAFNAVEGMNGQVLAKETLPIKVMFSKKRANSNANNEMTAKTYNMPHINPRIARRHPGSLD